MPYASSKLNDVAEDIEWTTAISVDEWHKEDTANGKTSVVGSSSIIENIDSGAKFLDHRTPCSIANIELYKSPENVRTDDSIVDEFAGGRPIEWIIGIRSWDREEIDLG